MIRRPARLDLRLPAGLVLPVALVAGVLAAGGAQALSGPAAVRSTATAQTTAGTGPSVPTPIASQAARRPADVAPLAAAAVASAVTGPVRTPVRWACESVLSLKVCSHGDDAELSPAQMQGEGSGRLSTSSTRVGCYGDGMSGHRIVPLYVRPVGSADRYPQYVDKFRGWAGAIEKAVDASAHKTGGARHVRFATTAGANCSLRITRMTLPADAFKSLTATIHALRERGLDKPGYKYLMWSEATTYCGIASAFDDNKASSDNLNNGRLPTYARVDRGCWGSAEAHEVMHMLGGLSPQAPHGTAGFHCNDGTEIMCYDDGTRGGTQRKVCGAEHAMLFDCRSDDYFSTAPVRGSWLAGHWNVAFSSFLSPSWTEPTAPAAQPSPTASPEPADDPVVGPRPLVLPSLPPLPPLPKGP